MKRKIMFLVVALLMAAAMVLQPFRVSRVAQAQTFTDCSSCVAAARQVYLDCVSVNNGKKQGQCLQRYREFCDINCVSLCPTGFKFG